MPFNLRGVRARHGADKTLKEVMGLDGKQDQAEPNDETRRERERELETKLIFFSQSRAGISPRI
jgi:hypothetical protein